MAGALAVFLLAGPSRPAAQGDDPLGDALQDLQGMNASIQDAKDEADLDEPNPDEPDAQEPDVAEVRARVEEAEDRKLRALRLGLDGQTIHGCRATKVIPKLEVLDADLTTLAVGGADKDVLAAANDGALSVLSRVEECGDKRASRLAEKIANAVGTLVARFKKKGDVGRESLRKAAKRVASLKRAFVAGELVHGCEYLKFFVLFQRIDQSLSTVRALKPADLEQIRTLLDKAAVDGATLVRRWTEQPCDGEGPPPPDGAFTVQDRLSWFHVNGFGTPPTRECNFVSTSPPQAGAQVTDVITRPSPQAQVTKTATTDEFGDAVISMNIDQTGTYTHQTTVASEDGDQATDTESQTVTSALTGANGQCPAPTP